MDLTFYEVTLQKLALVSSALSFWRKNDIQLKLKQFHQPPSRRGKEEFLIILIKEVMKKVNSDSLPSVLYSELLLAIKEMGYKMSNWFYYIRRRKAFRNIARKELYDKFLKDVYFTYYGTIDEMKILKLSWMTVPNVDYAILYIMACCYCSEELINELWWKMEDNKLQFYSYEHLCKRLGFHLVAYWNKVRENDLDGFYADCIVPFAGGDASVYDLSQSIDVNLFRLSVKKGYVRAVRYFGSKITKEETEKSLEFCFTVIMDIHYVMYDSQFYRKDLCSEIALYLSNFLTDDMKRILFSKHLRDKDHTMSPLDPISCLQQCLIMFIKMWPWQECFRVIFYSFETFLTKKQYRFLLSSIINIMLENFELGIPCENSVPQMLLQQLWHSMPNQWKPSLVKSLNLCSLFCIDVTSAKLIINDKQLLGKREDLINEFCIETYYDLSMMKGENDNLSEFINKILISPDWNKDDRFIIGLLYKYIKDGDFISVKSVLYDASEEEIKDFKMKINHEIICKYFITKNKYDLCDNFLIWKFEEKEDIINYKRTFREDNFTTSHILSLWNTCNENVEWAKVNSDKFLTWFLETELEIIAFKMKHFVNNLLDPSGECFPSFIEDDDNYEILEDFVFWCGLYNDAYQAIKRSAIKSLLGWSIKDCMKRNSIEKADKLLKWAFPTSEYEKISFMRSVWNGRRSYALTDNEQGILMCKLYVGKYWHYDIFSPKPTREEITENFKKFIRFFVKPYVDDFDKLNTVFKCWPDISKRKFEEIEDDDPSSATCYSESPGEGEDFEASMYCEKGNCELFLTLLRNEFACK